LKRKAGFFSRGLHYANVLRDAFVFEFRELNLDACLLEWQSQERTWSAPEFADGRAEK
jgi:hypothetical protein